MSEIIDYSAPSLQGGFPRRPEDLPHGLISPPERVRELIERERTKHSTAAFAKSEERLLNEWTIAYFFDYLNHEVLYRPTSRGPEVLAVGFDEIRARTDDMDPERMKGQETWMP